MRAAGPVRPLQRAEDGVVAGPRVGGVRVLDGERAEHRAQRPQPDHGVEQRGVAERHERGAGEVVVRTEQGALEVLDGQEALRGPVAVARGRDQPPGEGVDDLQAVPEPAGVERVDEPGRVGGEAVAVADHAAHGVLDRVGRGPRAHGPRTRELPRHVRKSPYDGVELLLRRPPVRRRVPARVQDEPHAARAVAAAPPVAERDHPEPAAVEDVVQGALVPPARLPAGPPGRGVVVRRHPGHVGVQAARPVVPGGRLLAQPQLAGHRGAGPARVHDVPHGGLRAVGRAQPRPAVRLDAHALDAGPGAGAHFGAGAPGQREQPGVDVLPVQVRRVGHDGGVDHLVHLAGVLEQPGAVQHEAHVAQHPRAGRQGARDLLGRAQGGDLRHVVAPGDGPGQGRAVGHHRLAHGEPRARCRLQQQRPDAGPGQDRREQRAREAASDHADVVLRRAVPTVRRVHGASPSLGCGAQQCSAQKCMAR